MPYDDELPNTLNTRRFVKDSSVRRRLQSLEILNQPSQIELDEVSIHDLFGTNNIAEEYPPADDVIAIDGSRAEVSVGPDRYNASIGFIEVAVVSVATKLLRKHRNRQFVDDRIPHQSVDESHIRIVMPSRNVVVDDLPRKEAWRKFTFDNLQEKELYGRSLFWAFLHLLEKDGTYSDDKVRHPSCPVCRTKKDQWLPATEASDCEHCSQTIYPTDRLRIHERLGENQSSITAINLLMQVVEQLCLTIAIDKIARSGTGFEDTVLMKDGPLAQFDTANWIARGLQAWLTEFQETQTTAGPLVIGLHKEGDFAIFAEEMREDLPGTRIVPMDSAFIYDNIVIQREEDAEFGESPKTYYGKNFIYKSRDGYVFPLTVPRRYSDVGNLKSDSFDYEELPQLLSTLEDTAMALYRDSVIPIHMAHDRATIPEGVGGKVLRELANKELFNADELTI